MTIISVIIPVYNSEKFIKETIESVLNQTYKDFEIIIIDDGSSDNSLKCVESFMKGTDIKVMKQNNSGPSSARNLGIKSALGKYRAFLDSDDIMMPDRLELQVRALEEDRNIGLVYTDLMTFNESGIVYNSKKRYITPHSGSVLNRLLVENFITTSTVMVRKECLDNVGYFDEKLKHSEDYKMWLKIAMKYKIGYVDLPLVKYRYHENSLSSNKITITASSYKVVEEFWKENIEYKGINKILYRVSVSKQLSKLGHAYYSNCEKIEAVKCLIKSLVKNPFAKEAYKTFLKVIIQSFAAPMKS